jgi:hypothetical protein
MDVEKRRATTRARVQRWREGNRDKARTQSRNANKNCDRHFVGIDGEGGGTDEHGRQNYILLCAGDESISNNGERLTTRQCLDFILEQSKSAILVGFYFNYDITMILRDMGEKTIERILDPPRNKHGSISYTYWDDYGIQYINRQFFRVCKLDRSSGKAEIVEGSVRTVHEVFGFFQCSFLKAITDWSIGTEQERETIRANKASRPDFFRLDAEMQRYCLLECRMLAELMTEFRETCRVVNIVPKAWEGAGWLAMRLLENQEHPKRPGGKGNCRPERPRAFEEAANAAYFGGRFEVSRAGALPGPVYENDIGSAYPSAMRSLPCPLHTEWEHAIGRPPAGSLYVADISFVHPSSAVWGGFPIRTKAGLCWPRAAGGWYWSVEIDAARRGGAWITEWRECWVARKSCDCEPYGWVEPLYQYRKSLGKSTRGYPLKLGLNSCYGKFAQRIGGRPYFDMAAAGIITAATRAQLIDAYRHNPEAVVMLATDGVYSLEQLPLDIGSGLGQWETKVHQDLFIVQSGFYWSSEEKDCVKTRGVPKGLVLENAERFEAAWDTWLKFPEGEPPSIPITLTSFIGYRLALARGKPLTAGKWSEITKSVAFDWSAKREFRAIEDRHVRLAPYEGSVALRSVLYDMPDFGEDEEFLAFDAMPDHVSWRPEH